MFSVGTICSRSMSACQWGDQRKTPPTCRHTTTTKTNKQTNTPRDQHIYSPPAKFPPLKTCDLYGLADICHTARWIFQGRVTHWYEIITFLEESTRESTHEVAAMCGNVLQSARLMSQGKCLCVCALCAHRRLHVCLSGWAGAGLRAAQSACSCETGNEAKGWEPNNNTF